MSAITPKILVDALNWRYATKKFDPDKKISQDIWSGLEQALVLTPSSYGMQPWKFIVVQDPETRRKLSAASWGQTQPVDCSHYVVFALRTDLPSSHVDRYIDRIHEVRGGAKESLRGFRDMMVSNAEKARAKGHLDVWMSRQVYIALGQFMASAALLRVDTCPIEGLEPAAYDQILGLPAQGYTTLCACAAGYRASGDKYASHAKVRFKKDEVVSYV